VLAARIGAAKAHRPAATYPATAWGRWNQVPLPLHHLQWYSSVLVHLLVGADAIMLGLALSLCTSSSGCVLQE
jgi:hypothetical protein